MPPHSITNFEIKICGQMERCFDGVYSRINLLPINLLTPNIVKDGAYVINLNGYTNIGTHHFISYGKIIK